MPGIHLKQLGFTYSVFRSFTKNKERIQKFKVTRNKKYIYRNELDEACYQHDMAYRDFKDLAKKDLAKRTFSDKFLRDKAFNFTNNLKYNAHQKGFASIVYYWFEKKYKGGAVSNEIKQNEQLAEELQKKIIKKFQKEKTNSLNLRAAITRVC